MPQSAPQCHLFRAPVSLFQELGQIFLGLEATKPTPQRLWNGGNRDYSIGMPHAARHSTPAPSGPTSTPKAQIYLAPEHMTKPPETTPKVQEISFRPASAEWPELKIDLLRPEGPTRATVIYAHGGGFSHGSRKDRTAVKLAHQLAPDGVAVASIDYRKKVELSAFSSADAAEIAHAQARTKRVGLRVNPQYCGPAFYGALEDFSTALGHLRERAEELALSEPFIALGASAGGIAALSLAYPPRGSWQDLQRPDAAMGICAAMVQPWRLHADGPPLVLMHGYHDGVISPNTARVLQQKANSKGAPVAVHITEVKGHRQQVDAFLFQSDEAGRPYLNLLRDLITSCS